jgi:hypothetical protein
MEHKPRKNAYWNWNIWLMKEYGIVESWTKQLILILMEMVLTCSVL